MNLIRPLGKMMTVDEDGFLINDCHQNYLLPPWIHLVNELRQHCFTLWESRLCGVYLRGSVPRGLAILNTSDLDSLVILQGDITPTDQIRVKTLSQQLEKRYIFCKKVEIILLSFEEILSVNLLWQAIIKTQSLWIGGENIQPLLPKIKPGINLVNHAFDLELSLKKVITDLQNLSTQQLHFNTITKKKCAKITRLMLRSGFEIVMEQDQSYTRDLYFCYQRFSHYYPQEKSSMYKTLELALDPSSNRTGLLVFLKQFGGKLVTLINKNITKSGQLLF